MVFKLGIFNFQEEEEEERKGRIREDISLKLLGGCEDDIDAMFK